MKRACPSPSIRTFCLITGALVCSASLLALNPKNAGPEEIVIKFKLPPPKPLTAEEELATFRLAPGFHAELVAAEPMVEEPIALSWDEKGRMFVCEMRGYMGNVEGAGESEATGRISMLEDTDGDGRMDKTTVFADGLVLPRAVMCVNGGALVAEPPMLYFMKDTDGDGKADVKDTVDAKFGTRGGQPEHMANSPTWLLDNWITCANHPARYRLKDGKFVTEPTASRGQWGMTQDDYGRPLFNFNSDFLRTNLVPESLAQRNGHHPATAGVGVQVMKDQTCWPAHPTPGVNRGYDPKQLRADGSLAKCTATCGAMVYRGGLFPKGFAGNVFIPEPAGNLVKRLILDEKDAALTARNAYKNTEFWTSTDERFRPINAYTGPDGALYVVDMYRGIIQHKSYLTHYLIANIKDRQLEQPVRQGRIWRIVPDGAKPQPVVLPADSAALVDHLSNANGWVRDTAQRLLVERKDASVIPALSTLAQSGPSVVAKLHALWTLEGLGIPPPDVIRVCLKDSNAKVRAAAVRLADRSLAAELAAMAGDASIDVQIALGFALSPLPEGLAPTLALARRSGSNTLVRDALLSGIQGRELEILEALVAPADQQPAPATALLSDLASAIMTEARPSRVQKLIGIIAARPANSSAQTALLYGVAPKKGTKPKPVLLESKPEELGKLGAMAKSKAKALLAELDKRLGWPNKPGFVMPPPPTPLTAQEQQLFDVGKNVYSTLCIGCHQPTGMGMPGLAPALVNTDFVLGKPEVLPRILLHGLTGPVIVNGQQWSLEMPPLGAALTDEQIAGVLTYVRREWEHTASAVPVEMVTTIRAEHKDRKKAWTAAELAPYQKSRGSSASKQPGKTPKS